ncbi:MAG: Hsp33 family molecular chaperone HslO [Syntrophomonadaceae bacterium]|nr:Hsp33 family molecular chaperone HslO [Syntrophomonadaceae bacterium]
MIDNDYLIKAVDRSGQVRISIAHTTAVVDEARTRHVTSATASAALGRVLTAALLMGSDMKGERDVLTIRVDGNGICGPIIATVDSRGTGRALISNPQTDLPSKTPGKLAVGELVGKNGFLEVIKDLGMKQPFVGKVPLVSGEIAEDVASYFLLSEQIPSLVSLGVLVDTDLSIKAAGGLIVQALPGADDSILEIIENNINALGPISEAVVRSSSLETIAGQVMMGLSYNLADRIPLSFKCNCNEGRLAAIMAGLSVEELQEIEQNVGKIEVCCNFCNERYQFELHDLLQIKKHKALEEF